MASCAAQASSSDHLKGTSWRFVSIDGQAAVSNEAKLEFRGDGIGANVGCNGMGGDWRIEDDRLIAGPLVQTQMYCQGPVWEQEQATSALLVAAPKLTVEGDRLMLQSNGHKAELTRLEGNP
jgi:heat shock protein HslJ